LAISVISPSRPPGIPQNPKTGVFGGSRGSRPGPSRTLPDPPGTLQNPPKTGVFGGPGPSRTLPGPSKTPQNRGFRGSRGPLPDPSRTPPGPSRDPPKPPKTGVFGGPGDPSRTLPGTLQNPQNRGFPGSRIGGPAWPTSKNSQKERHFCTYKNPKKHEKWWWQV